MTNDGLGTRRRARTRQILDFRRQGGVLAQTFRALPRLWAVKPTGNHTGGPVGQRGGPLAAKVSARAVEAKNQPGATGEDPEELHKLVVEHGDAIYRLALSVVRNPTMAEDIAQETLVKAWLALPSFRGDSSVRGWVLRIAHNTAISAVRRKRGIATDPYDMPEEVSVPERSVEARVQSEAVMDDFVEALDMLDDLSRSIVVLRELEGMSYEEISDVLDVPMPTVKTRLLRSRRKLATALRGWS